MVKVIIKDHCIICGTWYDVENIDFKKERVEANIIWCYKCIRKEHKKGGAK